MPGMLATIATVAAIIIALPFIFATASFVLHTVFNPDDHEGNGERAGKAIEEGVKNELPAWTDPAGAAVAFVLAAILVGGVWLWKNQ